MYIEKKNREKGEKREKREKILYKNTLKGFNMHIDSLCPKFKKTEKREKREKREKILIIFLMMYTFCLRKKVYRQKYVLSYFSVKRLIQNEILNKNLSKKILKQRFYKNKKILLPLLKFDSVNKPN